MFHLRKNPLELPPDLEADLRRALKETYTLSTEMRKLAEALQPRVASLQTSVERDKLIRESFNDAIKETQEAPTKANLLEFSRMASLNTKNQ